LHDEGLSEHQAVIPVSQVGQAITQIEPARAESVAQLDDIRRQHFDHSAQNAGAEQREIDLDAFGIAIALVVVLRHRSPSEVRRPSAGCFVLGRSAMVIFRKRAIIALGSSHARMSPTST
jgi:hypothetical protein